MTVTTVFGNSGDGHVESVDSTYATARDGGGTLTAESEASELVVGQAFASPDYRVSQAFFVFNTSSVPGTDDVNQVVLSLWLTQDDSGTDFTLQARNFQWGAIPLETTDFRSAADLVALPLVATLATSGIGTTGEYKAFAENGTLFQDNIVKAGITRFVIASNRQEAGSSPAGTEEIRFSAANVVGTTQDPKLVITHVPTVVAAADVESAATLPPPMAVVVHVGAAQAESATETGARLALVAALIPAGLEAATEVGGFLRPIIHDAAAAVSAGSATDTNATAAYGSTAGESEPATEVAANATHDARVSGRIESPSEVAGLLNTAGVAAFLDAATQVRAYAWLHRRPTPGAAWIELVPVGRSRPRVTRRMAATTAVLRPYRVRMEIRPVSDQTTTDTDTIYVGELIRLRAVFSTNNRRTDPTEISLKVKTPAGTTTTYTFAATAITRESEGVYYKDVSPDSSGDWQYQWEGTGDCDTINRDTFRVEATLS